MENKWWEYYAVRYFVGTVIGAIIVAYLNAEPGSPFEDRLSLISDAKEATFLGFSLVAALGFAFCYVASVPVLTLHATRAHLRFSSIESSPYKFGLTMGLSILSAVAVLWQFLPRAAAGVSGLVVGTQVGLVLLSVTSKFSVIDQFYRALATARSLGQSKKDEPPKPTSEFVTSYRHLREHGNAIIIVLLEGVLAYALLHSPSRTCAYLVLLIWLLPATAAWLIGTALESRLVSNSLP